MPVRSKKVSGKPRAFKDAWRVNLFGTTRSRVNYFMNKFRKMGLIEYNGGLQIKGSLLTLVLHE